MALGCGLLPLIAAMVLNVVVRVVPPWLWETPFAVAHGERIVEAVRAGVLRSSSGRGDVVLSRSLDYGFRSRRIGVTRRADGLWFVYFPTWNDRFRNRGYVYCSRPLTRGDFSGVEGTRDRFVFINTDLLPRSPVRLTKRLNPHWYQAYY